jgi:CDP-diglyceride synthetase
MAVLPRQVNLRLQFSLRFLLYVTALVALFYALRRSYLMTAFDLEEAIERARNVPTILTLAAVVFAAMFSQTSQGKKWSPIVRGAVLGAIVGSLSCLVLAIELGEALRRMDYWNWWKDWPLVAPYFIVATVQGGAIGAFVLQIGHLFRYLFIKRWANAPARSRPSL